ncbi:MAG: TolC family protein, partial [Acidobacteriaceae bacterium]
MIKREGHTQCGAIARSSLRLLAAWSAALICCALTGCVVGPKYHPPVTQAPTAYKEAAPEQTPQNADTGLWKVAQPQDAMLRGNWWEVFHEPELNTLEDQLNINNENIKVYFEDYMEARAIVREARAQYFPSASTNPSYTRSQSSSNLTNSTQANPGKLSSLYTLPVTVSWEPDLWGKIRNEVHAAEYNAQVSAADLENERLSEQIALADYFFEIRGQDALIHLYADTVAADKNALQLTQTQYETGVGDKISVVQAEATLQTAQSNATNLGILRAQYEHA